MRDGFSKRRALLGAVVAIALAGAFPATAADRPDAWITTKVKMALITSDGLSTATRIDVDTLDGQVTLHGRVDSPLAKGEAERVASSVEGVRTVRNLLEVAPASGSEEHAPVADDTLRRRVQEALRGDAALAGSDIEVRSADEGVVTLGGRAKSLTAAHRALEDAAEVDGVRHVKNRIESPQQMGDDESFRQEAYDQAAYARSAARDAWVTSATKVRLLADAKTPGFDINVDTRDGVVTLFGTVDSEAAKARAEADAHKVGGVKQVVNALQVVPPAEAESVKRTDEQLDEAIEQRFEASDRLATSDIDVAVENGVARLTGDVPSSSDQLTALTLARSTQGVRRVIDDLQIEPPAVGAP